MSARERPHDVRSSSLATGARSPTNDDNDEGGSLRPTPPTVEAHLESPGMVHESTRRVVEVALTTGATERDSTLYSLLASPVGGAVEASPSFVGVVSVSHEASLSRMTSATETPRLRASRSRRWATGSATTTRSERTSPVGLITRGLAILGTLIGGCRQVGECRQNRPHLYPTTRPRGRENESSSEVLRASSPESTSGRCLCRRGLREGLGQLVECRREQTPE